MNRADQSTSEVRLPWRHNEMNCKLYNFMKCISKLFHYTGYETMVVKSQLPRMISDENFADCKIAMTTQSAPATPVPSRLITDNDDKGGKCSRFFCFCFFFLQPLAHATYFITVCAFSSPFTPICEKECCEWFYIILLSLLPSFWLILLHIYGLVHSFLTQFLDSSCCRGVKMGGVKWIKIFQKEKLDYSTFMGSWSSGIRFGLESKGLTRIQF